MTYEEFLESYLINKEEFQFYYKNKIVNICYGSKGTFAYNINGGKIWNKMYLKSFYINI